MEMREAGLFQFWMRKSLTRDVRRCLKPEGVSKQPPLPLRGLSGAFIVLGTGTTLSIFVCIFECFQLVH